MKLFRKQKAVIVRFSENTNWHGVGPAVQSVGVAKLVWTIVFLAALGVCIWQLVGVFKRFLSNETSTSYVVSLNNLKIFSSK